MADTLDLINDSIHTFQGLQDRVAKMEHKCHSKEDEMHLNRQALVLYCQQFAFSPMMVAPCEAMLNCRDTVVRYDYFLHHTPHPQPHYH